MFFVCLFVFSTGLWMPNIPENIKGMEYAVVSRPGERGRREDSGREKRKREGGRDVEEGEWTEGREPEGKK